MTLFFIGLLIGIILSVALYLTFRRLKSQDNNLPALDKSYQKEIDAIEYVRKEKENEIKAMDLDSRIKFGNSIITKRERNRQNQDKRQNSSNNDPGNIR